MNLSSFVGQRLSFKRDSPPPSAGVIIAVTGIAISFIIMLLALSVVNGFKHEIVQKLLGFNAPITLRSATVDENGAPLPLSLNDTIRGAIAETLPQADVALVITQPAVLKTDSAFQGIVLRGVTSATDRDFMARNLIAGSLPDTTRSAQNLSVMLSRATASALGVESRQSIMAHFFDGNSIRSRKLRVCGIYDSHFNDFDHAIAFVPLSMLQDLFNLDSSTGSAIEIRGIELEQVPEASQRIYNSLLAKSVEAAKASKANTVYTVDNIVQQCALYINWLNLLDTNVIVIIILMACVSGFTLISSLFIIILERVNMIGLFKALGATNAQIRSIFVFMAQRLVIRGLVIGNIVGVGTILAQRHWHLLPLDPDAYYLNFVPMEFSLTTLLLLNVAVIVISALILIIPSHLISTLSPAKSIKYE